MDKIILIGGGGHCTSCIDVIEQENRFQIGGIVDLPDKIGEKQLGYPIIGRDEDLPRLSETYTFFLITLGQIKTPQRRIALYDLLLELQVSLPTVVSPRAYISPHAHINDGTIIMHNALVNAGATVGANCIINSCAIIEHDARIGDHCHISTNAVVNGGAIIAGESFVGSGAVIRDNIRVGRRSLIGGGANVMEDVPEDTFYTGRK
ncbi:acetyltransferase [Desulfopila inferna]|uniref:acetyltransferase n=1 Tax=Desulfopila inferna TaxID=468528 RepID=UPI0019633963|nr:acetyltransferase [Desulfopila inferna]MBM9603013.1 acetyltransferase [Desulfopila inferna]